LCIDQKYHIPSLRSAHSSMKQQYDVVDFDSARSRACKSQNRSIEKLGPPSLVSNQATQRLRPARGPTGTLAHCMRPPGSTISDTRRPVKSSAYGETSCLSFSFHPVPQVQPSHILSRVKCSIDEGLSTAEHESQRVESFSCLVAFSSPALSLWLQACPHALRGVLLLGSGAAPGSPCVSCFSEPLRRQFLSERRECHSVSLQRYDLLNSIYPLLMWTPRGESGST
jgi:hypothetical protein